MTIESLLIARVPNNIGKYLFTGADDGKIRRNLVVGKGRGLDKCRGVAANDDHCVFSTLSNPTPYFAD